MATATATPALAPAPITLEGHDHEFQYLKDEDRSEFTGANNNVNAAEEEDEEEVSPSDILAQLSAAELNAQSLLPSPDDNINTAPDTSVTTPEQPSEKTPIEENPAPVTPPQAPTPIVSNTKPMIPPPAPVKQKDEFQYWQEADDDAESVEISHLIAQQEQAPPSPIPYIPEDEPLVVIDEGPIEEPFDCMPVDDSEEGIMKQLQKVVQASDRVLHPNQYDGKGKKVMTQEEMAMMTPKRSGDPMKSPANSDCGSTIATGTSMFSRASVSIIGKNKKPQQPIMKLRVNDSQFEPLPTVINEVDEMPFDETTSHNLKTALRNMITATKAAAVTALSPTTTPDTTLMEDSETDDDTTNYGDEDEWTADDTSKYTDGTTDYTDTDEDTASAYTMETPMDEAPTQKSRKAQRRQKLLARARAVDKKTKEQAGWDEKLLDAVFSPDVTETALEVADFLQSGAEVTISMTKGMLHDTVTQLEKEERELNGIPEEEQGGDEEDEMTDAGEAAYRNIAAAATGSNLNGSEMEGDNNEDDDDEDDETNTQTTRATKESKVVKDPWDQPEASFGDKEETSFADLMQKGLPLMNRKLERMLNEWTKTTEEEEEKKKAAEDRVSAVAAAANEEPVVEPEVPADTEVAVVEPIETAATDADADATETPAAESPVEAPSSNTTDAPKTTPAVEAEQEEEKKDSEEEDDKAAAEDGSSPKLELEDAQEAEAAEEASTGGSLLSLEKPTKRLSV